MPSIKDFKNIQPQNIRSSIPGLWNMLDEFKTMIPTTTKNENKEGTKWGQEASTDWIQTEDERGTKWGQTEGATKETEHKVGSQPSTGSGTKWGQTEGKMGTKTAFSTLVGLQRSVVIFIYNECKVARSKSTKHLSIEYIIKALNSSYHSIKTTIKRLIKKGLINRVDFKNGRGGWSTYSIPDLVFQELLCNESEHKASTNLVQTEHKVGAQPGAQPSTASPVVVSNNNITTTTLPDDFEQIDCSP